MANQKFEKTAALVKRAREGDEQAFADLYSASYQKVYFFALSTLKNEHSAEDVVQDVFLQVYRNLSTLDNPMLYTAWLNRITYNCTMRTATAQGRSAPTDDDTLAAMPDTNEENDPFNTSFKNDRQRAVARQISLLPEKQRTVILMQYYQDMSLQDMASVLEVPLGTVKSRLNAAKAALAEGMKHERSSYMLAIAAIGLPIRKTILAAAHNTALAPDAAARILQGVVTSNSVLFTPAASAAAGMAATSGVTVAGGAAAAAAAVAVGGAVALSGPPSITSVSVPAEMQKDSTVISISLDGALGDGSVYAVSDSGATYEGSGTGTAYSITVDANGIYTVYVKSGASANKATVLVDCIDGEGPTVTAYSLDGNMLTLTLADDKAGVDFSMLYGQYDDGTVIHPISADDVTGVAVFQIDDVSRDFTLCASDLLGHVSTAAVFFS